MGTELVVDIYPLIHGCFFGTLEHWNTGTLEHKLWSCCRPCEEDLILKNSRTIFVTWRTM